ncbi:glycine dehydrogenase (aminomethyl-transferring), partial [bacterium]|nr:glycine dehydrogenase (aminomethyl-transferring) [bacterium]
MTKFSARKEHFEARHIGPNADETAQMLAKIGVNSLDELIDQTIPANIRRKNPMQLDAPLSEYKLLNTLKAEAAENKVFKSYIGMGYYDTIIPPVIL